MNWNILIIILLLILIILVICFNTKSNYIPKIKIQYTNLNFRKLKTILNNSFTSCKKSFHEFSDALTVPKSLNEICQSIDHFFDEMYEKLPKAPQPYIFRLSLIGSDGSMFRDSSYPIKLYNTKTQKPTTIPLKNSPGGIKDVKLFRIGVYSNYINYIDSSTHNGAIVWNSPFIQPINERSEIIQCYVSKNYGYDSRLDLRGKKNYFVTKLVRLHASKNNNADRCVLRLSLIEPMKKNHVLHIVD